MVGTISVRMIVMKMMTMMIIMTIMTTFLLIRNLDALVKNRRGMLRSSSCHNLAAPGLEQGEFVSHQIEPLSSEVNMSTLCSRGSIIYL